MAEDVQDRIPEDTRRGEPEQDTTSHNVRRTPFNSYDERQRKSTAQQVEMSKHIGPNQDQDAEFAQNEAAFESDGKIQRTGVVLESDLQEDYRRDMKHVLMTMVHHGVENIHGAWWRIVLRGVLAGAYIGFGAALSVVLAQGIEWEGSRRLMLGIGFAAGFSLVILSGAALFTEINVTIPVMLLAHRRSPVLKRVVWKAVRFWLLAFIANIVGGFLVSGMIIGAGMFQTDAEQGELSDQLAVDELTKIVKKKLRDSDNGATGWFEVLASGIVGNWLVGMAAINAMSARTVPGIVIGVFIPVLLFVSLGAQHGPANLGYFALASIRDESGIEADDVIWGNLIPSYLGNWIGAIVFDAVTYYLIYMCNIDGGIQVDTGTELVHQLSTKGKRKQADVENQSGNEGDSQVHIERE
eukprot:gb/GECG01008758.1/.p1 GENE.gb/GECG01008758.1/~~gb/GECG01008758.1/.p1  ORF type:complete len:411 (+),score=51.46 gb/GECG01008758.1/:1-1233(+)